MPRFNPFFTHFVSKRTALIAFFALPAFAGPTERSDSWGMLKEVRQNRGASADRPASRGIASDPAGTSDPDPDYDRLDGKGRSGKKVDVVEWEGNLEIHVYPAGSIKGIALKVDKRDENKPVMVIGYRFDVEPNRQLIRRAVLGIELKEPLKVFRDPSAQDYDKFVISNNGLAAPLTAYRLDPTPRQLYPDGHPALAQGSAPATRKPASQAAVIDPEDGTIQPFFTQKRAPVEN